MTEHLGEASIVGNSDLTTWIIVVSVVSMVLCTGGVAARLFARIKFANQELFLEDWLVIGPAYICTVAVAVALIISTRFGLGAHTDTGISQDDIMKTMKAIYAIQIPLFVAVAAIRTSLILFIQRLSRACSWCVYILATILIPINIIQILVAIFTSTFRCRPIYASWNFYTPKYTCMPPEVVYILVAFGLAIDLAIFVLPAILVMRLNITRKKKLQSIVMFALGGGGCIVEGIRFEQIHEAETSPDVTYSGGVIIIFIFFQVILGMLCCCAPSIKVFIVSMFASKFKCVKYLMSNSTDDVRETDPTRDHPSVARNNGERDLESVQQSFYEEASVSESMGWQPSTERIEMGMRNPSAVKDKKGKDEGGTIVTERRVMDLKEALQLDTEDRIDGLVVPFDGEGSASARSGSSGVTEEFHATPVEWGRHL